MQILQKKPPKGGFFLLFNSFPSHNTGRIQTATFRSAHHLNLNFLVYSYVTRDIYTLNIRQLASFLHIRLISGIVVEAPADSHPHATNHSEDRSQQVGIVTPVAAHIRGGKKLKMAKDPNQPENIGARNQSHQYYWQPQATFTFTFTHNSKNIIVKHYLTRRTKQTAPHALFCGR